MFAAQTAYPTDWINIGERVGIVKQKMGVKLNLPGPIAAGLFPVA